MLMLTSGVFSPDNAPGSDARFSGGLSEYWRAGAATGVWCETMNFADLD